MNFSYFVQGVFNITSGNITLNCFPVIDVISELLDDCLYFIVYTLI